VDSDNLLAYREEPKGQLLEEGITEAGSMGSFIAAGTSYSAHGEPMIPFFIFYSMFGFQRVGDLIWQAADSRARGFLIGATHGRTTLMGEGLQHQDGHSLLLATSNPAVRSYDPAFAYELAVVVKDGMKRMVTDGEDVIFYVTVYNEAYRQPPMPEGVEEQEILNGLYLFKEGADGGTHRAQIIGSGVLMNEALRAQQILADEWEVAADVWSAPSFQQLRTEALEVERWNRLHPEEARKQPYVTKRLENREGPVVAVSDEMKAVPDQIARWVPAPFVPLGTDGFGRSDTREALRRFFEVDAEHVVVATLAALAEFGDLKPESVTEAIHRYGIDPERVSPYMAK
jgi:pyruvate dehydrogenase E1 component